MATGAAPTLETKAEAGIKTISETHTEKPLTLMEHLTAVLTKVFQGREEYLGWRQ